MLLDSNIIIYAVRPEPQFDPVRQFIADNVPMVSAVSYVEVLGYTDLPQAQERSLREFFGSATVLPITQDVLDQAVLLRQRRKMTLGDALVAATALVHGCPLVTHNTRDFRRVADLTLLDPLEPGTP